MVCIVPTPYIDFLIIFHYAGVYGSASGVPDLPAKKIKEKEEKQA